jgi:hypothetical protein
VADFLTEIVGNHEEANAPTKIACDEPWLLYKDGSSNMDGSGAG